MSFNLLPGGLDLNGIVTSMNQNILELKNREKTEIFKDDTGTPRVILDNNGLRTTPAGIDVTGATAAQYSFNSAQNVFKIVSSGTISLPHAAISDFGAGVWQGYANSVSVTHSLGYAPQVIAYMSSGSQYVPLPYQSLSVPGSGSVAMLTYNIASDSTSVTFLINIAALHQAVSSGTDTVKYYLLQETAS